MLICHPKGKQYLFVTHWKIENKNDNIHSQVEEIRWTNEHWQI